MDKFICVFSEHDRDMLIATGFMLLKSDEANHIFVFDNQCDDRKECFSLEGIECVYTDTLTF